MKRITNVFTRFREFTVLVIIGVFFVAMTILSPFFLTWDNIRTTIIGLCCDGMLAIGMTIVLASGGIDLSVGALLGLAGSLAGSLYLSGMDVFLSSIIAIVICLLFGLTNGLLISKTKLSPLICTLATMNMARGLALVVTTGSPQSMKDLPEVFKFLGKGDILGFPFIILFFLILAILFDILMRRAVSFRKVFYIGSNEQSAVFSGINVVASKVRIYLISSLLAAFAGVITASRFGVATPTAGEGSELIAISAAVIGGASTNGGEGTILGTVLGLFLLNMINNALILLDVSVYWQKLISGAILLAAVLLDYFSHKPARK